VNLKKASYQLQAFLNAIFVQFAAVDKISADGGLRGPKIAVHKISQ